MSSFFKEENLIEIYTDGSCLKNPGKGGFSFMIIDHREKNLSISSKFCGQTTNNQMEMMSCVFAFEEILKKNKLNSPIIIFTDSQYLKNGINDWIKNWKKNNWKTASNSPVKNQEIWIKIDELNQKLIPKWEYVKAHAENPYNNCIDEIAQMTSKYEKNLDQEEINSIFHKFFPEYKNNLLFNIAHNLFDEKNIVI
jgi:ribonuclease HI